MNTKDTLNLSDGAKVAYQAFLDMGNSKNAHFDCLKSMDNKYESGGVPSLTETLELEKLLDNHNKNVLAFKTAMGAVSDAAEKQALVQLMR